MKLTKRIGNALAKVTGKTGLVIAKNSPEILVVVGIIGTVGSTILACRSTLRADKVLDKHEEKVASINRAMEIATEDNPYSEKEYKKDLTIAYAQTGWGFLSLFGPAIIVGGISILCIVKGHLVLRNRYIGAVAAYNILDKAYNTLFKRVEKEHGYETAYAYANGLEKVEVIEIEQDEKGKTKEVIKNEYAIKDPNSISIYAKFYDEHSSQWIKDPLYNLAFLQGTQKQADNLLKSKGYLFLNDVYDMLGLECIEAGQIVGWVLDEDNDNFIDFGLSNPINAKFINGTEKCALLDFNVDGVVYDKAFRKRRT